MPGHELNQPQSNACTPALCVERYNGQLRLICVYRLPDTLVLRPPLGALHLAAFPRGYGLIQQQPIGQTHSGSSVSISPTSLPVTL